MSEYRKLKVWEASHKFAIDIYKTTKRFPEDEKYGLVSQIRRSASSIPTNIVEGCGQIGNGTLIRFLGIAKGSAFEAEYQLQLAKDLEYINVSQFNTLTEKIKIIIRMLNKLIKSLKVLKPKTENRKLKTFY